MQEAGGTVAPLTALKRAELSKRETEYLQENERLRSFEGRDIVARETLCLFSAVKRICAEASAGGSISIQFAEDARQCHLRNGRVSLCVALDYSASGRSNLAVRESDKRLAFRGEMSSYMNGQPRQLHETDCFLR